MPSTRDPEDAEGLFTYGTLRRSSPQFAIIADFVESTSEDYVIRGTLYDLGEYPGLVLGGRDLVRGEVHRSTRLTDLLERADAWEGSWFARIVIRAESLSEPGRGMAVWVYEYRGETRGVSRCATGVWRTPGRSGPLA